MPIPKILHQIALADPEAQAGLAARARAVNPGWDYRLWTERDIPDDLVNRDALAMLIHEARRKYRLWKTKYRLAGIANILKYELLHRFGGVYIDSRAQLLNPLDDEVTAHPAFACWENRELWPDLISSAYLGAARGHPLFAAILVDIRGLPESALLEQVCPHFHNSQFLTAAIRRHAPAELHVYTDRRFVPEYATYATTRAAADAYCRFSTARQDRYAAALLAFKRVADAHGLRFFLICGTALGVRREGRFLVHDDDIDVGAFADDYDPAIEAPLLANGFALRLRQGTPASGYEVSFRHEATEVQIDLFVHYRAGGRVWFATGFHAALAGGFCRVVHADFSLAPVQFLDQEFLLPEPIDEYLAAAYGADWRTPRDFGFFDGLQHGRYNNLSADAGLADYLASVGRTVPADAPVRGDHT